MFISRRFDAVLCVGLLAGCAGDVGLGGSAGGSSSGAAGGTSSAGAGGNTAGGAGTAGGSTAGGRAGGSAAGGATAGGAPTAGGNAGGPPSGSAGGSTGPDGGARVPVFVAVGYAGVRVRSLDLGLTWRDQMVAGPSGDNQYLIRAITFGNGVFVTARGFPSGMVRVSPNGATWAEYTAPTNEWMGGLVWTGSKFVAAGGGAVTWSSADGVSWTSGNGGFGGAAPRTIAVSDGGVLMAASNGSWYRSDNGGTSWVFDSNHAESNEIKIAWCGGAFTQVGDDNYAGLPACAGFTRTRGAVHAAGVYLRSSFDGIERSLNGTSWTSVYSAGSIEDIEVGYVTP